MSTKIFRLRSTLPLLFGCSTILAPFLLCSLLSYRCVCLGPKSCLLGQAEDDPVDSLAKGSFIKLASDTGKMTNGYCKVLAVVLFFTTWKVCLGPKVQKLDERMKKKASKRLSFCPANCRLWKRRDGQSIFCLSATFTRWRLADLR